jgi:cytochrome P450
MHWSFVCSHSRNFALRMQLTVAVTAGTETSATAMTGLLYYLAKYPEVKAKLEEEVRSSFTSSEEITLHACSELKYLQACIEETLRIYPPIKIGFPRITPPQGAIIDGQFIPGGVCSAFHTACGSVY